MKVLLLPLFAWVSRSNTNIPIFHNWFFPTVPSSLVLHTSPTATDTTIAITGSVPSGSMVTGFVVQWLRDTSVGCSDKNQSRFTVNQGFNGSYAITGLEPGNRYTITVTVILAAGSAPVSNAVTATTMQTSKRLGQYYNTYPCYSLLLIHRIYTRSQLSQKWYSHSQ